MIIAALLLLIIPATIWHAFVTVTLWHWFIATQFGLPELTMAQAIGVGLIVATFTTGFARQNTSDPQVANRVANVFGIPLFLLAYGWVVTWFL